MSNDIFGVITGDIVKSSSWGDSRSDMLYQLKNTLLDVEHYFTQKKIKIYFTEIFRGDSFQGVIYAPQHMLKIAVFIKTGLMVAAKDRKTVDLRLGMGIGIVDHLNERKIEESDGEAFQNSGSAFEKIKSNRRLSLITPWKEINAAWSPALALIDALMQRWSLEQAEAVYGWLQGKTQKDISRELRIKQPAVSQRLGLAGYFALSEAFASFEREIKEYKAVLK